MGDLISLLSSLNLSPVITLLLGVLLYVFRIYDSRIKTLERLIAKHTTSIAVIKSRLSIEEDD